MLDLLFLVTMLAVDWLTLHLRPAADNSVSSDVFNELNTRLNG
ncbi:hypothetical protein [Spirosoma fluviale]|nr:hypothetical protein [Spirosoma fluviale]